MKEGERCQFEVSLSCSNRHHSKSLNVVAVMYLQNIVHIILTPGFRPKTNFKQICEQKTLLAMQAQGCASSLRQLRSHNAVEVCVALSVNISLIQ